MVGIGIAAITGRSMAPALLLLGSLFLGLILGAPAPVAADGGNPGLDRLGDGSSTPTSVTVTWTAVGDDSTIGTATYYDVRYSTAIITAENWDAATRVSGVPSPQPAGEAESLTVAGLVPGTTYYLALKVGDEVPNWSDLSNVVCAATQSLPDTLPPAADFTASPTSGYAPLVVSFTDLSGGAPTSWDWDFGDGGTSALQNPDHPYDNPGIYTVTLTAINPHGPGSETKVDYINVLRSGHPEMHVAAMVVGLKTAGVNLSAVCTVSIADQADQPLGGVTVHVLYTGPTAGTGSAVTDSDGSATIKSSKARNPSDEWCFEVTDVTHASYTYNPAANAVTTACESGSFPLRALPPSAALEFGIIGSQPMLVQGRQALQFAVPDPGHAELVVFSVAGRRVATLVDGWRAAGVHSVTVEASEVASGVYFLRLSAGGRQEKRRVMVIR